MIIKGSKEFQKLACSSMKFKISLSEQLKNFTVHVFFEDFPYLDSNSKE